MKSLPVFKESVVHSLRSSINENASKYLWDHSWIEEIYPSRACVIRTNLSVSNDFGLESPIPENSMDIENAVQLHSSLSGLTPFQARDPRLWVYLCHVDFWEYMRARWPVERFGSDSEKASRFILARYFVPQNQSRALIRNGVARLWWAAKLSHDVERENPYELTKVLLSTLDITQQILERGLGRAPAIVHGFLEFLLQNDRVLLSGGNDNRARIRQLAKFLNLYGGVGVLDCFSKAEVIDLLNREFDNILEQESESASEK